MSKAEFVKQMFDDISSKYDLLNDILSLGMHRLWKKRFVQSVLKSTPQNFLGRQIFESMLLPTWQCNQLHQVEIHTGNYQM